MKRPWMPFYPVDFQLDTLDLACDEIGVYMVLICLAWRRGDGSVTGDMAELKVTLQRLIADFHGLTFNRIVPKILKRYFEFRDGRWFQKRVEKELRNAEELSEKQSRNAKERWAKSNKNNDLTDANAMPSQSQSQSYKEEERKKDAADAAIDTSIAEKQLFERGKQILGKSAGGLIAKLLQAKGRNVALARSALELAATKNSPVEYIAAIIRGPPQGSAQAIKDARKQSWSNMYAKLDASIDRDREREADGETSFRVLPGGRG